MKKLIYCTLAFNLLFNLAKAQFTLEQVYDTAAATTFYYTHFQQNGEKFIKILFPEAANQTTPFAYEIRIYNLDHSLWKVIDLSALPRPAGTNGPSAKYSFLYVTDSLFNGDNLIEFMYAITRSDTALAGGPYVTKWNTYVYNENQTLLFSDTTAGPYYSHSNIPQKQVPIVNTSAGTKMILATPTGQVKVYGLSGVLPTQYESLNSNHEFNTEIYPNPSSNRATIKYSLPPGVDEALLVIYKLNGSEIKSFRIDNSFDNLSISTEELASGTYFYMIETSSRNIIQGKKFVTLHN